MNAWKRDGKTFQKVRLPAKLQVKIINKSVNKILSFLVWPENQGNFCKIFHTSINLLSNYDIKLYESMIKVIKV